MMENYQCHQSTYLFGQRFKNRLFVGGLPSNTTAQELAEFFANFCRVLEAKVIVDENNIPKGYGFVSFANEDDVKNVRNMGTLFLRHKKLNLGPAVRKQVPAPVENPELVVVNSHMRGEFFYPVPVPPCMTPQYLPSEPYILQGMVYNHPSVPHFPYGYVHQTAKPEPQLSQPFHFDSVQAAQVPNYTNMDNHSQQIKLIRQQQRRHGLAPRFRSKQRAS